MLCSVARGMLSLLRISTVPSPASMMTFVLPLMTCMSGAGVVDRAAGAGISNRRLPRRSYAARSCSIGTGSRGSGRE